MVRSRVITAILVPTLSALALPALAQAPEEAPPAPRRTVRPPTSRPTGGNESRVRPTRSDPTHDAAGVRPDVQREAPEVTPTSHPAKERQVVELEIAANAKGESWGRIVIELYPDRTPITVRNFVQYVNSGFYDGTIFHRVIPNFVVQGGGYTSLAEKKTEGLGQPIRNESRRGTLKNARGTIAMARKPQDPHSAVCQFYINISDNEQLDYPRAGPYGYCVFGKVIQGMEIVHRISRVPSRISVAAQRRYQKFIEEGRPVERAEQSEPINPPVIKHARMLDPSEFPASVTPTPASQPGAARESEEVQPVPQPPPSSEPAPEEPTPEPTSEPTQGDTTPVPGDDGE